MRTPITAVILVVFVAASACEPERKIPATVEWQGGNFQEVQGLADLPASIRSALGVGRLGLDGVADRGQPFNPTDVVDDRLPMRRFLAAGRDGDTWLVALEQGGYGYRVEVFLFSALEATPKQQWSLGDQPKTLNEIVQLLGAEDRKKLQVK
jgi:hypothetical protein